MAVTGQDRNRTTRPGHHLTSQPTVGETEDLDLEEPAQAGGIFLP